MIEQQCPKQGIIIALIKKIDKALDILMVNQEDNRALQNYNHYSELLERVMFKCIGEGYNVHTPSIDDLTINQRNVFDNALKNVLRDKVVNWYH